MLIIVATEVTRLKTTRDARAKAPAHWRIPNPIESERRALLGQD
jgi:hypothetical protein